MFWVVEIQCNKGTWAQIITSHATLAEAESKFYTVLAYASVSELNEHGAVLFDDKGIYYERKVYDRTVTE